MYTCAICNKEVTIGGGLHRHLVNHDIKQAEYAEKYPDSFADYQEKSRLKRKQGSPMCIEFYLAAGLSKKDAENALRKHLTLKNKKVKENKFKNPSTYDYWTNKGYTIDEAKEILSENNSRSLVYFKNKYGDEDGAERFIKMHLSVGKANKSENAIPKIMEEKKCSFEKAEKIYKDKHRQGPKNIKYWIKRGYTKKEAVILVRETTLRDSPRRIEYWIHRYNMTQEEARIAVSKFQYRSSNCISKESLILFSKIEKIILENKISNIEFRYGHNNKRQGEMSLYDEDRNTVYYYDFTVLPLNVIIEYHGSCWHPNPTLLTLEKDKNNWRQLKSNKSYDDIFLKDLRKKEIAIKNGFRYYEIWDTDNFDEKIKKILEDIL